MDRKLNNQVNGGKAYKLRCRFMALLIAFIMVVQPTAVNTLQSVYAAEEEKQPAQAEAVQTPAPSADAAAVEKPAAEKPAVEEPAAEEPAAEKPAAEEPAAEGSGAEDASGSGESEDSPKADENAENPDAAAPADTAEGEPADQSDAADASDPEGENKADAADETPENTDTKEKDAADDKAEEIVSIAVKTADGKSGKVAYEQKGIKGDFLKIDLNKDKGEKAVIVAVPEKGYDFDHWERDGVPTLDPARMEISAEAATYVAYFNASKAAVDKKSLAPKNLTLDAPAGESGEGENPDEEPGEESEEETETYTVTFYKEDKTTAVDTRMVDYTSNYCVNDIPSVPEKEGYTGKWVYGENEDFTNSVVIIEDTDVWAEYEQNVFTVTYQVEGETYQTDTYYDEDTLVLPADPVVEGKDFVGWYVGEKQYLGGEKVTSDLTLEATFEDAYAVSFVVINEETGDVTERLSQYYRSTGEKIGTLPQPPFVAGKVFEKWVIQGTDTEVTAETIVDRPMTVVAQFRSVEIYTITACYFYNKDNGEPFVFNTEIYEIDKTELPFTIDVPSSTETLSEYVEGGPVYYPEEPTKTVQLSDFVLDEKTGKYTADISIQYVKYTAEYDFVYMVKNLDDEDYTEFDREKSVQGVLHSTVTPVIKDYEYYALESAPTVEITQASGQELYVFYTRKNFQLSYETNGGSYVAGETVPYGTTVTLPAENPTRTGYTFAGWYSDGEGVCGKVDSIAIRQVDNADLVRASNRHV